MIYIGDGHIVSIGTGNRETVMEDTWGHLAPKPHVKYHGYIIVTTSVFGGDTTLLDYDFKNLDSNPWLYEDVGNFIFHNEFSHDTASIYRFDGWYKKFKNGGCLFGGGKFRKVCDVTTLS